MSVYERLFRPWAIGGRQSVEHPHGRGAVWGRPHPLERFRRKSNPSPVPREALPQRRPKNALKVEP